MRPPCSGVHPHQPLPVLEELEMVKDANGCLPMRNHSRSSNGYAPPRRPRCSHFLRNFWLTVHRLRVPICNDSAGHRRGKRKSCPVGRRDVLTLRRCRGQQAHRPGTDPVPRGKSPAAFFFATQLTLKLKNMGRPKKRFVIRSNDNTGNWAFSISIRIRLPVTPESCRRPKDEEDTFAQTRWRGLSVLNI